MRASGGNPLDQFDQTGWREDRDPGPNFDTKLYLMHNPDVAAAGIDPLTHYLSSGMAEGRTAYAAIGTAVNGFDAEYYVMHNGDVANAGVDALSHFNASGWHENRNPDAYFDVAYYLSHNPDIAALGINPLRHYEQYGWLEGRNPSAAFNTNAYLAANPDVAAAHLNPLDHYLNYGIYEGRLLAPPSNTSHAESGASGDSSVGSGAHFTSGVTLTTVFSTAPLLGHTDIISVALV